MERNVRLSPVVSQCLMCGRFYYNQEIDKCPVCGGLCSHYDQRGIQGMQRRSLGYDERCVLHSERKTPKSGHA